MFDKIKEWLTNMNDRHHHTYGVVFASREEFDLLCEKIDQIHFMNTVIDRHLHTINERIAQMALDLTALTEEVTRLETVSVGVETLLHTLLDEVVALKNDPVALQALVDRVKAVDDKLAQAVIDNTPAV